MIVYKIFNEDTQRFFSSNNKRMIWISPSGVATAVKYAKARYKRYGGNPDRIVVKKYVLVEI